jgi:hypothetical protein
MKEKYIAHSVQLIHIQAWRRAFEINNQQNKCIASRMRTNITSGIGRICLNLRNVENRLSGVNIFQVLSVNHFRFDTHSQKMALR